MTGKAILRACRLPAAMLAAMLVLPEPTYAQTVFPYDPAKGGFEAEGPGNKKHKAPLVDAKKADGIEWDKKSKKWNIKKTSLALSSREMAENYARLLNRLKRYVKNCERNRYIKVATDAVTDLKKQEDTNRRKTGYLERRHIRLTARDRRKYAKQLKQIALESDMLVVERREIRSLISDLEVKLWAANQGDKKGMPFKGCDKKHRR